MMASNMRGAIAVVPEELELYIDAGEKEKELFSCDNFSLAHLNAQERKVFLSKKTIPLERVLYMERRRDLT